MFSPEELETALGLADCPDWEEKEDEETKDEKKRLTEKQFPFRLRILDLKTNNPIEIKDRLKR